MKKIWWFCDRCKEMIASQRIAHGFLEETHLTTVGYQDWCDECIEELRHLSKNIMEVVDVNDHKFGLED